MSSDPVEMQTKIWDAIIKAGIMILVCLLIGSMISFFSPRATLLMEPQERFLFWISLCCIGGTGIFISDIILNYFPIKSRGLLKSFIQSICGTLAVLLPLYVFYNPAEIPRFQTTLIFIWAVMVLILMGSFILNAQRAELNIIPSPANAETENPVGGKPAEILRRLPVHLQSAELYALSAEDHYVRIHTSKGDNMILMRLSDALLETGTVEGAHIHRSWWVAKDAINDIKFKGRAAEVSLKNGVNAPVSRNMSKTLKEMGWF